MMKYLVVILQNTVTQCLTLAAMCMIVEFIKVRFKTLPPMDALNPYLLRTSRTALSKVLPLVATRMKTITSISGGFRKLKRSRRI
ncbi:WD domain-containing protein [Histoplasma capsulatum var. duboisii H88]|uniref:WD domain-containing protein n=1 Tax=Ajellomyces capsulatus (strain H88) TaxID=544711 RepID=A0A8A1LMK3_AJEC8|nr:WD domain-containing protein [Histoplasma capsulatum var. duboisii H88]